MSLHATHLIAGRRTESAATREVVDPADGSVVGTVSYAGREEATAAADAAAASFDEWSNAPARSRARVLVAAADLIERQNATDLAVGDQFGLQRAVYEVAGICDERVVLDEF